MATESLQDIDGHANVDRDAGNDDVVINGKIDGGSHVQIRAKSVTIHGRVDGASDVTIHLAGGSLTIDDKVDGASFLHVYNAQAISIGGKVDGRSILYLHSNTTISIGDKVDGKAEIHYWAPDVRITGKEDGGAFHVKQNWGNFPPLA